jgi:hypothetical protein
MGGFDHKGVFDLKAPAQPETEPEQGSTPEGTMEIKSENGQYTILARVAVTKEDEEFILNRFLNMLMHERKRMSAEKQAKLLDSLWLAHLIQKWDLPIPLEDKAKAIARLSQADRDYLYKAIMAAQPEKPLRRESLSRRRLSSEITEVMEKRKKRFGSMI